jgi:hypothetical protein
MAWNHDIIVVRPKVDPKTTHRFAHLSLSAISLNGRTASLQSDSEPKMAQIIGNPKNHALGQAKHFRSVKKRKELPSVMKALIVPKIP